MSNQTFSVANFTNATFTDEQLAYLDSVAQNDFGCGVYGSLKQACRETAANAKEILAEAGNVIVTPEVKDIEVAENLVKPSETVNQNQTKTNKTMTNSNNNASMGFTQFIASILFSNSSSQIIRTDLTEQDLAVAKAKAAKSKDDFIAAFSGKLIAPVEDTIFIQKAKSGKLATTKATGRLKDYFKAFNCYGIDAEGNPAEVKFNGELLEAAPADVEGTVVTNAYSFFARGLAQATIALTPADKAQFFALAFKGVGKKFKVTADSVIFHDVEFDFAAGRVHTRTQIKEVNPVVEVDGAKISGAHAVFMLALTCYGKSDRAVNTIVNNAVSLFKRDENYGAKTVDTDLAYNIYHNLQLAVKFGKGASSKFPFFSISSGKLNEQKLAEVLAEGGMAVVDKYNMKWLASGIAAEAVLLGRDGDSVINLNDANKPTKFYNRPASNKYSFAEVEGRVNSHFAVALSNGQTVYSAGRKLRAVWSNSRFGHGSGVAVINPAFGFNYTVAKSLKEIFNILTLPAAARAGQSYEEVLSNVCGLLNDKIANIIGDEFEPGQAILSLKSGDTVKTIVSNKNKAVNIRVKSGRAVISDKYEIDIKLDVEIVGEHEQFVKLRGIGKKCTTLPYEVTGIVGDWDILLNIEAVKGWPALIEMFCNSYGVDCYYNSNKAVLTTPDGEVDFKVTNNAFTEWCTQNAKETEISFQMARSCYVDHKIVIDNADDVEVIDNGAHDHVIIRERVQFITGDICFDVEVATPKESVSSTELTLEAANGVLLQDKALGEALMSDMLPKVQSAKSLVRSFMGLRDTPKFNVLTAEGRKGIAAAFTSAPASNLGFANHRQILKDLCKAFPNGFTVTYPVRDGEYSFEVHPRALATFGGFTSSGSATRELAQVIDYIYFITDNIGAESSVDAAIVDQSIKLSNTLSRWADNLVTSKSAMKKFTRSGKLVGGKVRTTYSPLCNNVNGLPVVVVNPNGPMAKMLGLDKSVTFGQIVGLTRTPMPFMTAAFVRLDNACPVGHVFVSPKVWHAANEGDSDGDGIALLNLTKYGVDVERALAINESLMGPKGYDYIYGADNKLPVHDFCAHDDKWGNKKSLTVWEKPIATVISVDSYGSGAVKISQHYKFNVGTSYAICSQLVFAAANALYAGSSDEEMDTLIKACVIAWRGVYEGLGLSGYTPEAKKFFDLIRCGAYSFNTGKIKEVNGEITYGFVKTTKDDVVVEVDAFAALGEYFPCASLAVIRRLVKSRATCIAYRRVENKGRDSFSKKSEMTSLIPAAIISGALRRLGQGNDPVEVVVDMEAGVEEQTPDSLFALFHEDNYASKLANPILAEVVGTGAQLHACVASELAARAQEEMM